MSGGADPAPAAAAPSPSPAAPAGSTPAAPPVTAAPATPPAEGSTPAGQAPATITIDINALPPEAKRFLDMKGGPTPEAVAKALTDGLDYNNRLGHRGDPAAAPAPGEPAPTDASTSTAPAPPAADLAVDPKVIEAEAVKLLAKDDECTDALDAVIAAQVQITKILTGDKKAGTEGLLPAVEKKIQLAELRLQLPEVLRDPVTVDEINAELRENRAEARELRAQARELRQQAREQRDLYNDRAIQYQQQIRSDLEGRAADVQRKAAFDTASTNHMQALEGAWPTAVDAAMTTHKIPANLRVALENRAMDRADANLNDGLPVANLNTFLDSVAQGMASEMLEFHREQSGVFGELAHRRAEVTGPPGTGVVSQVPQAPADLNDTYKLSLARLRGEVR